MKYPQINYMLRQARYTLEKICPISILKTLDRSRLWTFSLNLVAHINSWPVGKRSKLNQRTKKALTKTFLSDIEKLEKIIKRDLSCWK